MVHLITSNKCYTEDINAPVYIDYSKNSVNKMCLS